MAYIGEIRALPYDFAPVTDGWFWWMPCNGRLLLQKDYPLLFAVIGYLYGGAKETFAVPDLRGCLVAGTGPGVTLGQQVGQMEITLTDAQIPTHTHDLQAFHVTSASQMQNEPAGTAGIARTFNQFDYNNTAGVTTVPMAGTILSPAFGSGTGGANPHTNMQPVLAFDYFICFSGDFPVRPQKAD